jgi:hypothetical protein
MPLTGDVTSSDKLGASTGLRCSRAPLGRSRVPPSSGVYAIYLRTPGALRPFDEGEDGLIYIGLSKNLADREFEQHFSSGNTGFSTLRRSIGALLKMHLSLRAIPRALSPSKTNFYNYRFVGDGETRLTDWMGSHLEIGVHACGKYLELENFLISELRPLLNLTKWPNPQRTKVKRMRKVCADEARVASRLTEA